jgi:thiol-activated cytolysin
MSRIHSLLFAIPVFGAAACDASFGNTIDTSGQIDAYIRSLPYIPSDPPAMTQGQPSAPQPNGDYQCTTTNLQETRQYDKIVAYAANSDSLWPGAIVGGQSVYSGLFDQIVLPRQPETISVSLQNIDGAKSAVLAQPSLSSFRDAVTGIVNQTVTGATPANIYSEIERVDSDQELALAMGADVSWLGGAASIAASFDWSEQNTLSRYVVRYTQAYYTVDVNAPGAPSDFLDPSLQLADVQNRIGAQNPPLYVSSVTYGRMVVFTFESQYSAQELGAALQFAYNGGVDVSGDVSVTYKDIISSSKITAFILGGSGGVAAQSIDSYDDLMNFIKTGGDYSKDSPGAPIAYKLAYLKDNSPGRYSLTTDYDVKDCTRVSQKVAVRLESIRVDDAGGDPGNDLEIYGTIYAQGTDRTILFSRDSSTYVSVAAGTQFPQTNDLADAVIDVTPQPGQSIVLGAHLWDDDLIGSDDLGDQLVVAPFELGWKKEVPIYLTGEGQVVVTFSLQPI